MRPPSYQAVVAMAKLAGFRFEEKWEGSWHIVDVYEALEPPRFFKRVHKARMTRWSEGSWWNHGGKKVRSKGVMAMQILQRLIEEKENRP